MANGFFSRFRRGAAPVVLKTNLNFSPNNIKTLNTQVRSLVNALRKIRNNTTIPENQKNAMMMTASQRNAMNRAIVNFIKKYNKGAALLNAAVPPLNYTKMNANSLAAEANKNLSANNKAKLRAAINAKLPTLNATSRQYDLLMNAKAKLNGTVARPPPPNRSALNIVIAKTTNQKLQSNINNRNKSAALLQELKKAAADAGVNLENKNVNTAITRIMNHESRLPPKAGTNVTNRSRLNAALAKTANNKLLGEVSTRNQANALLAEVRNAAQAAGVNLKNANVNAALNRIIRHQSTLNP